MEAVAQDTPHLIITDINMPDGDGFWLLDGLRTHDGAASFPVIVMTSGRGMGVREEAFRRGASDFVEKPIDHTGFIPRVKRHIMA